mgnify:CR=1 FL=1
MIETVLTLANNQIMENEKKKGIKKKGLHLNLIGEKEAKIALRITKGNIWQAIEKCVKRKEDDKLFGQANSSSFSLKISGPGNGKDNEEANFLNEDKNINDKSHNETNFNNEGINLSAGKDNNEQNKIEIEKDLVEGLLENWKRERDDNNREMIMRRKQVNEKEKFRKILELQRRMSEYDSDEELDDGSIATYLYPKRIFWIKNQSLAINIDPFDFDTEEVYITDVQYKGQSAGLPNSTSANTAAYFQLDDY